LSDLALTLVDGGSGIDLAFTSDGSSLLRDNGLETAVLISLFTDQRVAESELPPGHKSKKGWWGDAFLEKPGDKIGSKIWTFARGKLLPETAAAIQVRARQALEWMIEDGVALTVDVVATLRQEGFIEIVIQIARPDAEDDKFTLFWDGQALKR